MNTDEKQIVITRLHTMPDNMRLCMGEFNGGREEIIREVENETEVGETIVKAHMMYLRSFKAGEIQSLQNDEKEITDLAIASFIKSKDHYDNCYYRKRLDTRILEKTKARYETRLEDLAEFKRWILETQEALQKPLDKEGYDLSKENIEAMQSNTENYNLANALLKKLKAKKVLPP